MLVNYWEEQTKINEKMAIIKVLYNETTFHLQIQYNIQCIEKTENVSLGPVQTSSQKP